MVISATSYYYCKYYRKESQREDGENGKYLDADIKKTPSLSDGVFLAEEKGFEPLHPVTGLRDFESRLFDHLSTPPYLQRAYYISEN